jgi:hypothetical protein
MYMGCLCILRPGIGEGGLTWGAVVNEAYCRQDGHNDSLLLDSNDQRERERESESGSGVQFVFTKADI